MADKKISDLPAATSVNTTDEIEILQVGVSKRAAINKITAIIPGAPGTPALPGGSPFSTQYNNAGVLAGAGPGTAGQVLMSNGVAAPTFQAPPAASPNFSTQYNNGGLLTGAGPGTTGQVLTSNGAAAAPTFQTPATTPPGGSDFSTQYKSGSAFAGAGPGTTGQVLTSNGAGVAPTYQAAPGGTPGGSGFSTQYNNAGVFAGAGPGTTGQVLTSNGAAAAPTFQTAASGGANLPQNEQNGNYTTVLSDAGKHIYHPSGAAAGHTYTIAANASVAYAIGDTITFVNRDDTVLLIAINSDTLRLAGFATSGTRSLGGNGIATALKIQTTEWLISGTGLT